MWVRLKMALVLILMWAVVYGLVAQEKNSPAQTNPPVPTKSVVTTPFVKGEIDRASFEKGVLYALQAMENLWSAKAKVGAQHLTGNVYYATVLQTATGLAITDRLVFAKADSSKNKTDAKNDGDSTKN